MSNNALVGALNQELADAGNGLVGNADLLRGVLAGCGDCIKVLDLDGRLQFMSDGGKRVMEVENFAALKGCPWPDFWTGDGNAQATAALAEARAGRTHRFRSAANTAKGNPRFWDVQVSPIFGEDGKPVFLLSISRDITEEWKAVERQQFLVDELKHRVKNTLTTVVAIAHQSLRGDDDSETRKAFVSRVHALSNAFDILEEVNWSDSPVSRVVESALMPFHAHTGQISIAGPIYNLSPKRALALALAINELATNATKYGALSSTSGTVSISWIDLKPGFEFAWREAGGPAPVTPTRTGFGSRLIQSVLAEDFGGTVDVQYAPSGLVCVLKARN